LAALVEEKDLQHGAIYPPLTKIRFISLKIAIAVAKRADQQGLNLISLPDNLEKYIKGLMYDPRY
jgi:malate dehydrogenase (oxaloacetate-decarboxylating)(NADP+)